MTWWLWILAGVGVGIFNGLLGIFAAMVTRR